MDVTTQRRCLAAITGSLLLGTVGAVYWAQSDITSTPRRQAGKREEPKLAAGAELDSDEFDGRIAAQSLRGPLYDPPPPVPAARPPREVPAPPKPQPTLEVTLVGTIIESDRKVAIIADSTGKFDIKGVGEALELSPEGMTVDNIDSESVTLQYAGRRSTVSLERSKKKKNKPAGGGRRNNRGRER